MEVLYNAMKFQRIVINIKCNRSSPALCRVSQNFMMGLLNCSIIHLFPCKLKDSKSEQFTSLNIGST